MTAPSNPSYPKRKPCRPIEIGQRFGHLVVREHLSVSARGTMWELDCDCGKRHRSFTNLLNSGQVQSCGCSYGEFNRLRVARNRPTLEQPCNSSMRLIPLNKGRVAIVDADDYERLSAHNWSAEWNRSTASFYVRRWGPIVDGRQTRVNMGREILGLEEGDPRNAEHAFHNTLDNRKIIDGKPNLRIASSSQNQMNRRKSIRNQSGYKGVAAKGKLFIARITANGVQHFLGSRPTAHEAHLLYVAGLEKYHGEFGNAG